MFGQLFHVALYQGQASSGSWWGKVPCTSQALTWLPPPQLFWILPDHIVLLTMPHMPLEMESEGTVQQDASLSPGQLYQRQGESWRTLPCQWPQQGRQRHLGCWVNCPSCSQSYGIPSLSILYLSCWITRLLYPNELICLFPTACRHLKVNFQLGFQPAGSNLLPILVVGHDPSDSGPRFCEQACVAAAKSREENRVSLQNHSFLPWLC